MPEVPSVGHSGVRAFLGMPLTVNGQRIGNFCVVDMQPRAWSEVERETVIQLAKSTQRELAVRAALSKGLIQADHADALARSKEQLMVLIAHDLRDPLQVLELSLVMLRRANAEQRDAAIARAITATLTLRRMADELLSNNGAASILSPTRVPLSSCSLLSNACEMMMPIAERRGITLLVTDTHEALVEGDFGQLLRVLCNLLSNAIKYSPHGTTVRLSGYKDHDSVVFEVRDEGPGMSSVELERAFDQGWQGELGIQKGAGQGLGLSIVKQIVEQHHGQVSVQSSRGAGCRFRVRLPTVR